MALNIYDAVAANRRNTAFLMVGFMLVVAIAAAAIGIILVGDPVSAAISGGIGMVVGLIVAFFAYRGSDKLVLRISGAHEVDRRSHPQLVRTVENLCIGAGLPMPKIFVIDDSAPNAFATGRDPNHAAVAITTGLLDKLEPLELEGVMAHELCHIRNVDTRFMVMTAVLVGFVALLADIALRATLFGAGRRRTNTGKGGGAGGLILFAVAIIALILAPIIAKLMHMVLSRQREYLADASAVLLTRYPEGLASALQKLEADTEPLESANKATEHLYIVNPLKGHESKLNNMFATHPPLEDRVARLRAMAGQVAEGE